tara:strand:- start:181 stop:645 length:465 start_codon:yes stop_codon:yes gene_type:complete
MSEIVLVSAEIRHTEMIWEWRNDPITRKMFVNSEKVSWEKHTLWYEKVLIDKCIKIYIGEEGGIPIGLVRFNKRDDEEYVYEVSINISPASRRKGFGKQLLTNGIKRLHKEVKNCKFIRAEVKKENKYSNKLFKSCGFIFIEDESGMNTYELSI